MRQKKEVIDKINKNKEIIDAKIDKPSILKNYGLIGLIVLVLAGCLTMFLLNPKDTKVNRFKEEYEALNGKTNDKGQVHTSLDLRNDIEVVYSNYEEINNIIDNGTGVIYFGFPECPWCRALLPNLFEAANTVGVNKIYYLNNREERDTKELDEKGKVITTKEGTEEYNNLVKKLYDYLGEYQGLKDKTIKRLYFPTVLFVYEGKVKDIHIGTFDGQKDPRVPMTDEEKQALQNTLVEKLNKTIICDSHC